MEEVWVMVDIAPQVSGRGWFGRLALAALFPLITGGYVSQAKSGPVIQTYEGDVIDRPLGYMTHRLPPAGARTISISEDLFSFSAQQVCGYTDWSTAVLKLPKELLSAKYWMAIAREFKEQAVSSVLAVSGALPSMLACNASPTFCHILNHAEMMSQANLKFTFDGCQVLEGLANSKNLQSEPLRNCVQKLTSSENVSASVARERCLVSNNLDNLDNKDKKNKEAASKGRAGHTTADIIESMCAVRKNPSYKYSSHAYSVTETTCELFGKEGTQLFPGLHVKAGGSLRSGGTFQLAFGEKIYDDRVAKVSHFIVDLLDLMHELRYGLKGFSSSGPLPKHKVIEHPEVKKRLHVDNSTGRIKNICYPDDTNPLCKTDMTRLPPVYRLSAAGGLPVLIVEPATLYEILDLIPKESTPSKEYNRQPSRIALIIEPLIQATSYSLSQDILRDGLTKAVETCTRDPKFFGAAAQEDCKGIIQKLEKERDSLELKQKTDKEQLYAQLQFYSGVEKLRKSLLPVPNTSATRDTGPMADPTELR